MKGYTLLVIVVLCAAVFSGIDRLAPVPRKPGTTECGLPTPPPDALHQRVIDRCVACHIEEGVVR